jgi:hypothetical protein
MSAAVRERLAARERETLHSRKLSGLHLRRDTLTSVLDEKERQVPPTPIPTTPGGVFTLTLQLLLKLAGSLHSCVGMFRGWSWSIWICKAGC